MMVSPWEEKMQDGCRTGVGPLSRLEGEMTFGGIGDWCDCMVFAGGGEKYY